MRLIKVFTAISIILLLTFPCFGKDRNAYDHNELGFKLQKNGNYEEALKEYSLALSSDPNYFAAQNNLGTIYYILGNYTKAIDNYYKALELNPKSYAANYSLGLAQLEYALTKKNVDSYSTNNNKLSISVSKNDLISKAIENFSTAKHYNPNNYQPYSALGIAYINTGNIDKAVSELEKALKLNPKDPISNYYMGLALQLQGNNNCIKYYKTTIKEDSVFLSAYLQLSKAFLTQNNKQLALIYAKKGREFLKADNNINIKNIFSISATQMDSQIKYSHQTNEGENKLIKTYQTPIQNIEKEQFDNLIASIELE